MWIRGFGGSGLSVVGSSVSVMFDMRPEVLDADGVLSDVVAARAASDRCEVRVLEDALRWADLHGTVVRLASGAALPGLERLVQVGGVGTPEVAEFAAAELAAVLGVSTWSGQRLVADALDLRHRLPRLWARVQVGEVRPYVARQVADRTRRLSLAAVAVVDDAAARVGDRLTGTRLEKVVEAAILTADPHLAAEEAEGAEAAMGVWDSSTDAGTRDIVIRTDAASAVWFDASVDRIADGLSLLGDTTPKQVRRGRAVGVIAQPQQTLDLYATVADLVRSDDHDSGQVAPRARVDSRPPATLYVHLTDDAVRTGTGVARVEGVGPVLVDQVRRWLGSCQVTVKPVIDLNGQVPVDAYEIPDRLREAAHLRSPADVFPYGVTTSRRQDLDHTVPWRPPDDGGPPGQTRLDNLGPMTRQHHRIKTHSKWKVLQPFDGVFVWRSPTGRYFLVDSTGTRRPSLRAR